MDIEKLDFDGMLWITPEVIGNASQCGTHITESVQCRKKQFDLEICIFNENRKENFFFIF